MRDEHYEWRNSLKQGDIVNLVLFSGSTERQRSVARVDRVTTTQILAKVDPYSDGRRFYKKDGSERRDNSYFHYDLWEILPAKDGDAEIYAKNAARAKVYRESEDERRSLCALFGRDAKLYRDGAEMFKLEINGLTINQVKRIAEIVSEESNA